MNAERMMLKGQLAEAERALKQTEIQADGQLIILRMKSMPTILLQHLKTEEIIAAATALHRLAVEATKLRTRIAEICEALGMES